MGRMHLIAFLAIALAGAAGLARADASLESFADKYQQAFQDRLDGWWQLGIAAISVSFFFNVLAYMAGYAFQSEHLKKYARSEFLHVTASSLMIFSAVWLMYNTTQQSAFNFMGYVLGEGSSSIDCAASGGKFYIWNEYPDFGSGPIGAFKCKVQEKIDALERSYNNIVTSNRETERATSVCINLFGVPIYCGDWDQSLHNEVEQAHLIAAKIVGLLMPLHAQFVLAEYIQKNMLAIFLPMGLLLRILPVSRGVGGLFIAIAIGFFFIWPTFFLLTDPTFVKVDQPAADRQQGMCFTGFKGSAVVLQGVLLGGGGSASALAIESGAALVYEITIATLFYPFVALAITLAFVRAATPLLGGDAGELMRMVSRLG